MRRRLRPDVVEKRPPQIDQPVISIHHIFSAYKALGWNDLPKFAGDNLKDLKHKREYKWIESGNKRGEYKINAYGSQQVAKWWKKDK